MYAVELRFTISDQACAPSSDVLVEGLMRGQPDLRDRIEHIRVRRRDSSFDAVLFLTATSAEEANVVGSIIGFAADAAISAVRFAGVQPWPDPGEPVAGAEPEF